MIQIDSRVSTVLKGNPVTGVAKRAVQINESRVWIVKLDEGCGFPNREHPYDMWSFHEKKLVLAD